jgi:hypothetical protein
MSHYYQDYNVNARPVADAKLCVLIIENDILPCCQCFCKTECCMSTHRSSISNERVIKKLFNVITNIREIKSFFLNCEFFLNINYKLEKHLMKLLSLRRKT